MTASTSLLQAPSTTAVASEAPATTAAARTAGSGSAAAAAPAERLLASTLRRFKLEFAWVVVFSMVANVLMLTPTLYMLQVFDRVMASGGEMTLAALTLLTVFLIAVMGAAEWMRSRLLVRAGARFDLALNTDVFRASFEARLAGGARNPLQAFNDLMALRQFLTGNGIFAIVDTPWSLVYVVVLFLMHPWLGWAALGLAIVMMVLAVVGTYLSSKTLREVQETQVESNAYLQAKLRNAETVHALGMLASLRQHWLAIQQRQKARQSSATAAIQQVQAATKFLQYMQQSLMLAVGALLAIDGQISPAAMIAANALMGNALRPIGVVVQTWRPFIEARQAFRRLSALLTDYPEREGRIADRPVTGQISLRGLSATAPGRQRPILQDLNVDFKAGEVVAIIGPSGAGKSTLARCLVGIWPETQGQLLLDGDPIDAWSREHLGPHIGYLPQDIEVFDGTIAENIARFAKVDSAAVIDAATRTGIHEMILRLPKGYDTPMGEAGGLLSGGQRQRIGLARAILGHPQIVVLDEPNANLDDVGEVALVRTVRDLKSRGKTVFMIVHQQHLLVAADRVLFLEDGRITRFVPLVIKSSPAQG